MARQFLGQRRIDEIGQTDLKPWEKPWELCGGVANRVDRLLSTPPVRDTVFRPDSLSPNIGRQLIDHVNPPLHRSLVPFRVGPLG